MSTTIDNRVLEMRFDNKQFESGVATSMSTLDKLKQKLNLSGASKGLENLGSASKKINFSGMTQGIESVNAKFSAMQVVGMTALSNITTSAMRAGKNIASALTIEPIKTGFQEYETQLNSVQTILSNTMHEGTNIKQVNAALDELNTYADLTIYNFTEMTRNIGTFTAAGVGLKDSVAAIKGIANLAAVSGSSSQQASVAMYQLSQALAAGKVQLMDWNSVVNAGMGGKVFQDALIRTSELLGTGAKAAIDTAGTFRESLTKSGWLTTEVLTETLKQISGAYTEADLLSQGYSKSQAAEIMKLAKQAVGAAQDVKTFTQMFDVLKESAQSGWAMSWRIIFGDFVEAKTFFTDLTATLTGVIDKFSSARNAILEGAFGKTISGVGKNLDKILGPAEKVTKSVKTVTADLNDLGKVVDDVILGKFGNGQERFDKLTKAGYNWMRVQNKVNKTLNDSKRYTKEQIESQDKLLGSQKQTEKSTTKTETSLKNLSKSQRETIKSLGALSDEQLRAKGYTEEQISALNELRDTAKSLGVPFNDLIDNINKLSGRFLLLNGIKNIGRAVAETFKLMQTAWSDVFGAFNEKKMVNNLFNAIKGFSRLTYALIPTGQTAENLTRIFRGLFSAIDLVTTIVGGGFKLAFIVVQSVCKAFGMSVLEVAANIADLVTKLNDWVQNSALKGFIDTIAEKIPVVVDKVRDFISSMKLDDSTASGFKTVAEGIQAAIDIIYGSISRSLGTSIKILTSILALFGTNLGDVAVKVAGYIIQLRDWIKENTFFIGSVDKVSAIIVKLAEGISSVVKTFMSLRPVKDFIKGITESLGEFISKLDFKWDGSFLDTILNGLSNAFSEINKWLSKLENSDHFGIDLVLGIANGIQAGIGMVIGAVATLASNVISTFCGLLGIHSPSTVAYQWGMDIVLGLVHGIQALFGLAKGVMSDLGQTIANAFNKIDWGDTSDKMMTGWEKFKDLLAEFDYKKLLALVPLGVVLYSIKKIFDLVKVLAGGIKSINGIIDSVSGVFKSMSKLVDAKAMDIKAGAFRKIATSIAILVGAIFVLTKLDSGKVEEAVGTIIILSGVLVALAFAMDKMSAASMKIDKNGAKIEGLKSGLLQIALSLGVLALVVKMVGTMKPDEAKQGFVALAGLMVAMAGFVAACALVGTKIKGLKHIDKIGNLLLELSISMLLMVRVCKLAGNLSAEEMLKGAAFAAAFVLFVRALVKASTVDKGSKIAKLGGLVFSISFSLALLVGVCKLAGTLNAEEMLKGAAFAAAFIVFVRALVKASTIGKGTKIAKLSGLVLSISISLGFMAGACKLIGKLSVGEMIKGAAFAAAFVLFVKKLVSVLTISNEAQIAKVSATILAISIAIGILAGVSILLSMMDLGGLTKGIAAVGLLSAMVTAMLYAARGVNDIKGTMTAMAVVIGVLAGSIILLSYIDPGNLAGATAALSILMGMFSIMMKMSGMATKSLGAVVTLTLVVAALAGILTLMSAFDTKNAISNAVGLSALLLSVSAVTAILSKMNVSVSGALKGVLALTMMAVPLLAFVGVLAVMSMVSKAAQNAAALTKMTAVLALLLIPLTVVGALAPMALAGVLALTAMAIPMLAFVGILALMNKVDNATQNATLLIGLMTVMTSVLTQLARIGPMALIGVTSMAALTLVMGAIGGLATAVGALMTAFPSLQKFLNTGLPVLEQLAESIGTMIGKFIGGVGEGLGSSLVKIGQDIALFMATLQIASMQASGIKASSFDGVKELMSTLGGIALTSVGTSIADVFSTIFSGKDTMEKFKEDGIAFFGAMSAISEASEGVTVDEKSMNAVIKIAQKLAELQSSLNPIGGVVSWFTGRDDLGTFGKNIGLFISSMTTTLENLDASSINTKALSTIIKAAQKLADLQSSLEPIGGVISWFVGRDDLAKFGSNIGRFIVSIKTAFENLDGVTLNEEALSTVISATKKLAKLQSSLEPIGGVITWFTGRDDLGKFGSNISQFITFIKTAFENLDGVTLNEEALGSIISAAKKLSGLQSSLEPIGGVINWLTGRDDLGTFGSKIAQFMTSMKLAFSDTNGTTINTEALASATTAAEKIKDLAEKLKDIDYSGIDDFTGVGFGKGGIGADGPAYKIGMAIKAFNDQVVGIEPTSMDVAITAVDKIRELILKLTGIDYSSVSDFTGVGIGLPGADGPMYKIGKAIAGFGEQVANINIPAVDMAVTAADKLRNLISKLTGLDTTGVNNLKVKEIGQKIAEFSSEVTNINIPAVNTSVTAAAKLRTLIASLTNLDTSGISNFKIGSIGKALSSYASDVGSVNYGSISSSVNSANRLRTLIAGLSNLDTSGVSSYVSACKQLAKVNVSGIVKAFSGASSKMSSAGMNLMKGLSSGVTKGKSSVTNAIKAIITAANSAITKNAEKFSNGGKNLISKLASGMSSNKGKVTSAMTSILSSAASSIRGYYSSFYSAGASIGEGLAAGIRSKVSAVQAAAAAIAAAAATATRAALQINSPSKVFMRIGSSVPEGLAKGISKYGYYVRSAANSMASDVARETKGTMTRVDDLFSYGMDTQPIIRPVVDLSNVQAGANAVNGMFNAPSVGVMSSLGSISMNMNNRQNGNFDDVVYAINKLRNDLGNVGNTSYTINGITYDDGSSISEAVSSLIRAARIERRV